MYFPEQALKIYSKERKRTRKSKGPEKNLKEGRTQGTNEYKIHKAYKIEKQQP